mgnify:CR=1 FL=1
MNVLSILIKTFAVFDLIIIAIYFGEEYVVTHLPLVSYKYHFFKFVFGL